MEYSDIVKQGVWIVSAQFPALYFIKDGKSHPPEKAPDLKWVRNIPRK